MKRDHELSNPGGIESPEEVATALIRASSVTVNDGAILLTVGQSGGQVAQTINNIFDSAKSTMSSAATVKFHEKRLEIYGELWQQLGQAQGAVYRVASGIRRIRNVDRVTDDEFREFVQNSSFTLAEKGRLLESDDRTKTLSEVAWSADVREAREAYRVLHNYANATRIYLSDSLKSLLSQATALVTRIVIHAEIVQAEERLNFDAALSWLKQLDGLLTKIEAKMSEEMRNA